MENIKELLKKYNQEHLVMFYGLLSSVEKKQLVQDIASIDFETIAGFKNIEETVYNTEEILPVKAVRKTDYTQQQLEYLKFKGRKIIERRRKRN